MIFWLAAWGALAKRVHTLVLLRPFGEPRYLPRVRWSAMSWSRGSADGVETVIEWAEDENGTIVPFVDPPGMEVWPKYRRVGSMLGLDSDGHAYYEASDVG